MLNKIFIIHRLIAFVIIYLSPASVCSAQIEIISRSRSVYHPQTNISGVCYISINENECKLAWTSNNKKKRTIPSKVKIGKNFYTVVEIAANAFITNSNLREVILPSTLKVIGDDAFAFTNISDLTIPTSVEKIGCIRNCAVSSIKFPNQAKVETAYKKAFLENCPYLYTITNYSNKIPDLIWDLIINEKIETISKTPFGQTNSQIIAHYLAQAEKDKEAAKKLEIENATEKERQEVICTDGFVWIQALYSNGLYGVVDNKTNTRIIPPIAKKILYSDNRFLINDGVNSALYTSSGECLIPLEQKEGILKFSATAPSDCAGSERITYLTNERISGYKLTDAVFDITTGKKILNKYNDYSFVCPGRNRGISYILVKDTNDKYGICNWEGEEIVSCKYTDFDIRSKAIRLYTGDEITPYADIPYENLTKDDVNIYYTINMPDYTISKEEMAPKHKSSLYHIDTSNYTGSSLYSVYPTNASKGISNSVVYSVDPTENAIISNFVNSMNETIGAYQQELKKNNNCSFLVLVDKNDTFSLLISYCGALKSTDLSLKYKRNEVVHSVSTSDFPQAYGQIYTPAIFRPGDKISLSYTGGAEKTEYIPLKTSNNYYSYCAQQTEKARNYITLMLGALNRRINSDQSFSNSYTPGISIVEQKCSLCGGSGIFNNKECPSCRRKGTIPHIIPYDGIHDPRDYH